jgi:nucleotide-binding universal stress UspA family protein
MTNDLGVWTADDCALALIGSSTHAMHRMIGSAAVSLARRSPVALVIVP